MSLTFDALVDCEATLDFSNLLATSDSVQMVDVISDNALDNALFFKLDQLLMGQGWAIAENRIHEHFLGLLVSCLRAELHHRFKEDVHRLELVHLSHGDDTGGRRNASTCHDNDVFCPRQDSP